MLFSFWKMVKLQILLVVRNIFLHFCSRTCMGHKSACPTSARTVPSLCLLQKKKQELVWVGLSERWGGVGTVSEQDGWGSKIHSASSCVFIQGYLTHNSEGSYVNKSLFMSNFLNNWQSKDKCRLPEVVLFYAKCQLFSCSIFDQDS